MSEGVRKQVQYSESLADTDNAIRGIHKALRLICSELEDQDRRIRMLDSRVEDLESFQQAIADAARECEE